MSCDSCQIKPAVAKGLCKACYNRQYWSSATPGQLGKRRESVKANYIAKTTGTFKRKTLVNPTPEETKERVNRFVRERRAYVQHVVNEIKTQLGCIDCGYNEHPIALDFDHITEKNFGISRAISRAYSIERILKEIENCEVRCANCHRIVTLERKEK